MKREVLVLREGRFRPASGLARIPRLLPAATPGAAALLAALFLPPAPPAAAAPDPVVSTLVSRVSLARMHEDLDALVSIGTRRCDEPGGLVAQDYLHGAFGALGFVPPDLYLQDFDARHDNVVAVFPGTVAPDEIHVLGAHYDSISDAGPGAPAPGADDNGSGTAAVLEIARVVRESGLSFEATIVFAAFAGEEYVRLGSVAFVSDWIARGKTPATGLVLDVMGYLAPASALNIAFGTTEEIAGVAPLIAAAGAACDDYVPATPWEYALTCT